MKLAPYKKRHHNTFTCCINSFFTPLGGFYDEEQREIENEAINLVIKKYGKDLENRLKRTEVTPSYRSWYENDCFESIAEGTCQDDTCSAMKWLSVNVCSESPEIMES